MTRLLEFTTRHPLLVGALIVAWLAVMFYELRLRSRGSTHVTAADAVRLINSGALVIDVRKPEEYAAGHIVNARNVALDKLQQGHDASKKQKDKILLTVCDNGLASGRAGRGPAAPSRLSRTCSTSAAGSATWRAENLPLVK